MIRTATDHPIVIFGRKFSIFLWITVVVIFGTYIRNRPGYEQVEADWLTYVQLLVCFLGGVMGILQLLRAPNLGFGAKIFFILCLTNFLSIIFSQYPKIVIGYWGLYFGAGLLTLGIIKQCCSIDQFLKLESLLLLVITLILIKDTITGFFFPIIPAYDSGGPFRLGMELVHANKMSFLATLAFLITCKRDVYGINSLIIWLQRALFITIILYSRSRSSLLCLLIGLYIITGLKTYVVSKKGFVVLLALPCILSTMILVGLLGLSLDINGFRSTFDFVNRGQSFETLTTITGRTEIWSSVIKGIFTNTELFLFGHGYGATRLALNENSSMPFIATHSHNTFLERLFSTGLIGFIPFLVMVSYGFFWFFNVRNQNQDKMQNFSIRSASIISVVFINSITESYLAIKIGPIICIYLFYFFSLDSFRGDLQPCFSNWR